MEWAELLGYVEGDGAFTKRRVTLYVAHREADLRLKYEKDLARIYGLSPGKTWEDGGCTAVPFYSVKLVENWRSLGLKVRIPDEVLEEEALAFAYLRGLFTADGCINWANGQISLGGNLHLREQVSAILGKAGVDTRIYDWNLNVRTASSWHAFDQKIGFSNEGKQRALNYWRLRRRIQ